MTDKGKGRGEERREVSPEVKAIEAQLWAEAGPHQRVAAQIIGRATGQEDLPHILAELRTVDIKDAIEARLVGLQVLHGGAKGSGGPEGVRNGNWRHGGRSSKVLALRAMERRLLRMAREALEAE